MEYKEFIDEVNARVEEDTTIISTEGLKVGEYVALHQRWFFDGIKAESLIFKTTDVKNLDKTQLIALAKEHLPKMISLGSSITYSQNELHTFLNFNFKD